jgi:hypothetical protein
MLRVPPASITVLSLALAWPLSALAQGVFKCVVDGKTVYQSSPCASDSKELIIPAGPSDQAAKDARSRANAEKARAARPAAGRQATPEKRGPPPRTGKTVGCDELRKQRAAAFGRRNDALRDTRQPFRGIRNLAEEKKNDAVVDKAMAEIQRLENQMQRGGCGPPD